MTWAETIASCAESWVDTPYSKGSVDRSGADCAGFAGGVFKEVGILEALPVNNYNGRFWTSPNDTLIEEVEKLLACCKVTMTLVSGPLQRGDFVIVTQFKNLEKATHVLFVKEVLSHSTMIIHARQGSSSSLGLVEVTRMPPSWRILRTYRVSQ